MEKKIVGILGGMGPEATCDLYLTIIRNTKASSDQEHIHVLIDSDTQIADRTEAIIHHGKDPLQEMVTAARRLETAGADFLIMPCNTAHYFYGPLTSQIDIPMLNMIEETAKVLKGQKEVIILCTEGTKQTGIYDKYLQAHGIKCIYPAQPLQDEVTKIIYEGVKKGKETYDVSSFNEQLSVLDQNGKIISLLACTELPLAYEKYHLKGNFLSPTECLAKAAIREAGYEIKE